MRQRHHGLLRLALLALAPFFLWSSGRARAGECTVFAAASLSDALQEIARNYEKTNGDRIIFNFGGSSGLARQIGEGAKADLFFSADEEKADQLEAKGLVKAGSRRSLLSNTLVFVAPPDSEWKLPRDLPKVRRLALAETTTVPAGIYARKYLEQAGLWKELIGRIVPVENVRAALATVESGNADAAIVYKTDAAISRKVRVAYEVPRAEGPSISYVLVTLKEGPSPAAAERLRTFLAGEEASGVFRKHGFIVLPAAKPANGNS